MAWRFVQMNNTLLAGALAVVTAGALLLTTGKPCRGLGRWACPPTPTPVATAPPTASPSPVASASPTPLPTASPTPIPTPTPSPTPTPTPTVTPPSIESCGVPWWYDGTYDRSALWPVPYATDRVWRWCTETRPITITVIDRTSSPWWHDAIELSAASWALSPLIDVVVVRGESLTGVGTPYVNTWCAGEDGFVVVVCNYFSLPGGDWGNAGNQAGFGDHGDIVRPYIIVNDWWGANWGASYSAEYATMYAAGTILCHELGHTLGGAWHWPYQPVKADGTLANSCLYNGLGPGDALRSLETLYP